MAIRRLYTRQDGKWAWQLLLDGNIVAADGGQGYANESDARDMVNRIIGGEFADAEKRIRRGAPTAKQAPKPSPKEPAADKAPEKQPAPKKVMAKKKTAQKPGSQASTSGQSQPKRGGGEVTVPKGHRPPPGPRNGEQRVNVDPTNNKSSRTDAEKNQPPDKKAAAKKEKSSPRNDKASDRITSGSYTSADVRAWARGNGYAVAERGRVPQHISAAYRAAH